MNKLKIASVDKLAELVALKSKHSVYQLLHPLLQPLVSSEYQPLGKHEVERQRYMAEHLSIEGRKILDIGANTGYFSFAAIEAEASKVVCFEGNAEHASFIENAANYLGVSDKILVKDEYFNFQNDEKERYDTTLCLNVLHHLGDDFGDPTLSLSAAKVEMINSLNRLAARTVRCWIQLGFNWKGNRHCPLFANGTKRELIDFVQQGTQGHWVIDRIAVVDPVSQRYVDASPENLQRFDSLGEFLNRPLFLLTSQSNGR